MKAQSKDVETRLPKCCQKCRHATDDGNCRSKRTKCSKWRLWFSNAWNDIQKAAKQIKEDREKERIKK